MSYPSAKRETGRGREIEETHTCMQRERERWRKRGMREGGGRETGDAQRESEGGGMRGCNKDKDQ